MDASTTSIDAEDWAYETYMPEIHEVTLNAYNEHITFLFSDKLPPSDDVLRDFGMAIWRAMSHEAYNLLEEIEEASLCPACGGSGGGTEPMQCRACGGTGKARRKGHVH